MVDAFSLSRPCRVVRLSAQRDSHDTDFDGVQAKLGKFRIPNWKIILLNSSSQVLVWLDYYPIPNAASPTFGSRGRPRKISI
ncbi:uncharacterized protein ARMOST_18434 [Armillaria ostoyae]|uniref:Uncharacterized protein n=1 Tax=Armillaria ostoyae TaxID=47428 RepID=A0A284S1T2_ARMOS|nr:uncharacterized protein ARMOST_18434 [Armillaria ostoyae]